MISPLLAFSIELPVNEKAMIRVHSKALNAF